MKKIFNLILLILLFTNSYSQQNASLLYNWQDSSLVGSWAYDNIYNECWGVYINDHEIAIIGSTAGTHFFDITDPENAYEIDFVQGVYGRWCYPQRLSRLQWIFICSM